MMEQILNTNYDWITNQYFMNTRNTASTMDGTVNLDEFDEWIDNLKYFDKNKTEPVSQEIINHLIMASMS